MDIVYDLKVRMNLHKDPKIKTSWSYNQMCTHSDGVITLISDKITVYVDI